MHRLSQEKQEGNPTKLLTHRSAFIHDVSPAHPASKTPLFRWLAANPTTGIKNPKVSTRPTLPFPQDEMVKILAGIQAYVEDRRVYEALNPARLRALVLFLRYSGLRISDAVACPCARLIDGKLRLYTQKTGTHVYVPLPEFVVKELSLIQPMSEERCFIWRTTWTIKP
jgi:integrase